MCPWDKVEAFPLNTQRPELRERKGEASRASQADKGNIVKTFLKEKWIRFYCHHFVTDKQKTVSVNVPQNTRSESILSCHTTLNILASSLSLMIKAQLVSWIFECFSTPQLLTHTVWRGRTSHLAHLLSVNEKPACQFHPETTLWSWSWLVMSARAVFRIEGSKRSEGAMETLHAEFWEARYRVQGLITENRKLHIRGAARLQAERHVGQTGGRQQ